MTDAVPTASGSAGHLLARTLAAFPRSERQPLVAGPGARAVPATAVDDPAWLREQIRLRGQRWGTDDRRVLGTLWWYSASVWIQGPSIASLLATGTALSPLPQHLTLHWKPDSVITGATSTAVLPGEPVAALASALRSTFEHLIGAVSDCTGVRDRPLWAIATDSLAGRLLWAGRALGDESQAVNLGRALAARIGPPLLPPRYIQVPAPTGPHRFVRRVSCCLLYAAPAQQPCSSCPRRHRADRLARLRASLPAG